MKNIYFLTILIAIVAFLSGCNRSEYYAPTKPIRKIASIIYEDGTSKSYEYNSNGDVTKITAVQHFYYSQSTPYVNYFDTVFTTFTYKKDSIIETEICHANAKYNRAEEITYFRSGLNFQGYISAQTISSAIGDLLTYQYDNFGHCIKSSVLSLSPNASVKYVYNYSFSNGNLSSVDYSNSLLKYEYYTDKDNTLSNESFGSKFMGKDSKNLVKKETISQGSYTGIDNYEYEFDKDNYPIKKTTIYGNTKFSETYTYK